MSPRRLKRTLSRSLGIAVYGFAHGVYRSLRPLSGVPQLPSEAIIQPTLSQKAVHVMATNAGTILPSVAAGAGLGTLCGNVSLGVLIGTGIGVANALYGNALMAAKAVVASVDTIPSERNLQ